VVASSTHEHCSIIALQNLHREIEAHYFVVKPPQDEQLVCCRWGAHSPDFSFFAWHCM